MTLTQYQPHQNHHSILDVPDELWSGPDRYLALYERLRTYLEIGNRTSLTNQRFGLLQDELDMLRDHSQNAHAARLEWIVIVLILVECLIGVLEIAGLTGLFGGGGGEGGHHG